MPVPAGWTRATVPASAKASCCRAVHARTRASNSTGIVEGARFDDLANTIRLGGYATLDVRGEYAFTQDWNLQARVANVFDRDYQTAAFYNQPGRELQLTLRYAPAD